MRSGSARRGLASRSPRLFALPDHSWTSDDYLTPPWLFDALGIAFDVDVCAPRGGVPWIPAATSYDLDDNGLAQSWAGRVWCNPPYSEAGPWVDRFIEHEHGIALLPHSRSRWHSSLWRSDAALADVVEPSGRMFRFIRDGTAENVYVPIVLAAFGDECVEAIGRVGRVR